MPRSNRFGVTGLYWDGKRSRYVFDLRLKGRRLARTTAPLGLAEADVLEWARRKLAECVVPRHSKGGLRFPLPDGHPKRAARSYAGHGLDTMGIVYVVRTADAGPVKIGWAKNLIRRLESLQIGNPSELVVLASWRGTMRDEKLIHWRFRAAWKRGEWFALDDEALAALLACDEPRTRSEANAIRRKRALVFARVGEESTGLTHYKRMKAELVESVV